MLVLIILFNLGVSVRLDLRELCSCYDGLVQEIGVQFVVVTFLFVLFCSACFVCCNCVMSVCQSVSTSPSRGNHG